MGYWTHHQLVVARAEIAARERAVTILRERNARLVLLVREQMRTDKPERPLAPLAPETENKR